MRKKLYDRLNNRLIYIDQKANEEFWDAKWEASAKVVFDNPPSHRWTVRMTRRYLSTESRVLEGGCGLGDKVYALHKAGYSATGIDYAPRVVQAINARWPHLNATEGDVRKLPFEDSFYDGYWSIGVIEHFPDGYDAIAREMQRVLRPGGYLFLSFPSFNPFRQSRAAAGKYPQLSGNLEMLPNFYQFALNPSDVQEKFESLGFDLVSSSGVCSLGGLAEDWPPADIVQRVIGHFPAPVGTAFGLAMDKLMGRYSGHSALLIFRKSI